MLQLLNNMGTLAVLIDGVLLPSGFADGNAVEIEPNAPLYSDVVGADGALHQSTTEDQTGLVRFRAKNTSGALRAILDGYVSRHEIGANTTPSTIVVTMLSTGEKYVCTGCRPMDRPTVTFGNEVSDREYTWRAARITRVPV